jgi:hypothetical protein
MSAAINTLARTTVLDAVADTAGSPSGLKPAKIDNTAIEAMLRRGRRWRISAGMADDAPPLVIEQQAAASTWDARFRRSRPPAISFFVSLTVHLLLLLVAALVAVQTNQAIKTMLFVEAALADSDQEELVTLAAPLEAATTTALDDARPAAFITVALDPGVMQEGAPAIALVNIGDHAVREPLGSIAGLADGAGDGLASEGEGKGSDKEGGAAGGNGTEFFGVQGRGNKFVFVCDCSGSMSGLKWFELNRELSRCIGSLVPGQAFYAIFFDGEMHPMFEPFGREPALLDATSDNIEKARQWIANKSLGRNTSPCDSMKFAASLEPDAIFLLTDGEFSDYTAPYMRDFNKKRVAKGKAKVVVHTIGFFSQKHQMVLERIAKDSGGTYQFVAGPKPVKERRKSQNVIAPPLGRPEVGGPAVPASAD